MDRKEKRLRRGNALLGAAIALLVPVLLLSVLTLFNKLSNPYSQSMLGVRVLFVESQSMEPKILTGAYVVVYEAPFDKLRVGDIISFREPDGALNTHRIVADDGNGVLTTKGDNNDFPDERGVTQTNYCYKHLLTINAATHLREPGGVLKYLAAPAAALLLLIIVICAVFTAMRRNRRRKMTENTEAFLDVFSQSQPQQPPYQQPLPSDYPPPYQQPLPQKLPPNWRDSVFDGVDFSDLNLLDPTLQDFELQRWIFQPQP